MHREERHIQYDAELELEAYHFSGIMQRFPNHFHDYYVVGYVHSGYRLLSCKNREYKIAPGNLVLFNPKDNHTCAQLDYRALDWRCLNISESTMRRTLREITGEEGLPVFTENVVLKSGSIPLLQRVHTLVMERGGSLAKEEAFLFLIKFLLDEYAGGMGVNEPDCTEGVEHASAYIDAHYAQGISLAQLCGVAGLGKYTLLRHFTRQKGVTPYQYLEAVRIGRAKKLLEEGNTPLEAALQTGFSDQSHFTRFFKSYIGLTPGQYQAAYK